MESNKTELFSDYPEFDALLSTLSHLLFDVNGDISTLQQFLETLESGIATGNSINKILNKSVNNIENVTNKMIKLKQALDELLEIDRSDINSQRLISRDKIVRDVDFSVKEFKKCQERLKNFDEKLIEENKSALLQEEETTLPDFGLNSGDLSPNYNKMDMIVERDPHVQSDSTYQNNLYAQRNAEIERIQSNIQDVNTIFKDLNTMVLEQGLMVDTIESNMYSVENNTGMASKELTKALEYQKKKSKIIFYFFFFLLMIFLLMIMASL
ncbi:SNAP receptor [Hanseniaspora uvarum]|nr:SNAP receptor [Hanseniaspora uvarum]